VYDVALTAGSNDEDALRAVFSEWTRNLRIASLQPDATSTDWYLKQVVSAVLRHCKRMRSYEYEDVDTSTCARHMDESVSLPSQVDASLCPVDYQAQLVGPYDWVSIANIDTDSSLNLSNCSGDTDYELRCEVRERIETYAAYKAADEDEWERCYDVYNDLNLSDKVYNDEVAYRKVVRLVRHRRAQLDAILDELRVYLPTDVARMVCDSLVRLPSLVALEVSRVHYWHDVYTHQVLPRLRLAPTVT
jgi:hypothetical protein